MKRRFCCEFKNFLQTIKLYETSAVAMSTKQMTDNARKIFQSAVESVQPENLINSMIEVHSDSVVIQGKQFSVSRNVHIVGFGKAVLGMGRTLERKLQNHIVSGILSVPVGITESLKKYKITNSPIKVYEGALNNIPDENSQFAALKISELVSSLGETDLLFVLISGGGSALLPSPKPPLTLEEKLKAIKLLTSKGASIEELNAIRKRLSTLKGGGLAELAKPAKTVCLILSDIVGDPISFIASGPTVENTDDPSRPLKIIEKYNLKNEMPEAVLQLIQNVPVSNNNKQSFSHVSNFIIGNNRLALKAAATMAESLDYTSCILTDKLCGSARFVGAKLITLIAAALQLQSKELHQIAAELKMPDASLSALSNLISRRQKEKLCILLGGETTVEVVGTGIGGRNQELVLASSLELSAKNIEGNITLLSAGTDGIDGPTDAAGAIVTSFSINASKVENLNPIDFLNNNDSYNFFNRLCNGEFHVKIGHTGTNVMDIIIILIE